MKFSEKWLRTFVDPPLLTTSALADLLTFGGIEIEGIHAVAPAFARVVVGEVLSVEKHPDADRLRVCQVKVAASSTELPLTIVCGAPNVRAGMRVPVALVGAKLPGVEIKVAKVRGVESSGMLCSARELGLSDAADGLLELSPTAAVGISVRDTLDLDDAILDSKPTPNRGDCLSLRGIAREVSALCGAVVRLPAIVAVDAACDTRLDIALDAPAACPLYCGRLIRGVDATVPTPEWMVRRLARSGIRAISAVVDITNYVMLELGQPMHAFDAEKLDGGIHVRFARAGDKLELLNGESRQLTANFLVIADEKKALALAGIMGGAHSAVTDATRTILLEAAYFDPAVIAGKSRELGFGSDSSFRFERGVDFASTRAAMERATRLVLELCGGMAGPVTTAEAPAHLPRRTPIVLRLEKIERVLGVAFSSATVAGIFERLTFQHEVTTNAIRVTPPAYRFDITIEEDLIEEVARIHGYNRIPAAAPMVACVALPAEERTLPLATVRHLLAARDYQEVVTYSFVARAWEEDFCANVTPIALANPIASQLSELRSSLIGGLVGVLAYNQHHKQSRVRVFEVGRCFLPGQQDGQYLQPWRIGAAACGSAVQTQWGVQPSRTVDFYDVKADLEALFEPDTLTFEAAPHPAFHPGKSACVLRGGNSIGWIGELHPRWRQKYDLTFAPVLFDVAADAVVARELPHYETVSKYPPVWRDLAVIFDENVEYQAVVDAINAQKPAAVIDFSLFDIYRDAGMGNGKKSLAFRMLVQDTQKTMTDAEVDSVVSEIIKILQNKFNAKLR